MTPHRRCPAYGGNLITECHPVIGRTAHGSPSRYSPYSAIRQAIRHAYLLVMTGLVPVHAEAGRSGMATADVALGAPEAEIGGMRDSRCARPSPWLGRAATKYASQMPRADARSASRVRRVSSGLELAYGAGWCACGRGLMMTRWSMTRTAARLRSVFQDSQASRTRSRAGWKLIAGTDVLTWKLLRHDRRLGRRQTSSP